MLSQTNRILQFNVPSLGQDIFIPIEAYVFEAISQSFYATIECLSNHIELNPEKILGKLATLAFVDNTNQVKRYVNGFIAEFEMATLKQTTFRQYRLTLRPYFWLLNFGEDCQSFTGLSVIEIIKNECHRLGIYKIDLSGLTKNYECLAYKVQFNESHFNFLSRLMEEAGISYYYRHNEKQHTLVLVDETKNFPNSCIQVQALKIGEEPRLPDHSEYISKMHTALDQPALFAWNEQQTFQPLQSCTRPLSDRRLNQQDFSVRATKGATMTTLLPEKYCVLAFPQATESQAVRKQMQEALNNSFTSQQLEGEGKSNYFLFTAGCLFEKDKQRYLLTEITHHAFDYSYLPKEEQQERFHLNSGLVQQYQNNFKHLPATFSYAAKPTHKKTRLGGIYPAFVTAPDGQGKEIYTNELGDVQVRFPWQHKGEHTPFIPVMQTVAGHNFGNQFIPRVGEEIWVVFQEGDPELPIVLGSTPNNITLPVFDLEENPNLTWIKTKTLKQGDNDKGHHLVFDDTPYQEKISLHVEGNYLEEIVRDSIAEVEGEEEISIQKADLLEALNSEIRLEAKRIILSGGGSEIILSEHGLEIKGSTASGGRVNLFSCGGGKIRPIVRVGDKYECPKMTAGTPHYGGPIIQGSPIVSTKGHAIARQGDKGICLNGQDQIKKGINSVLVDDKPIACLNNTMEHGGVIKTGADSVFVGEKPVVLCFQTKTKNS